MLSELNLSDDNALQVLQNQKVDNLPEDQENAVKNLYAQLYQLHELDLETQKIDQQLQHIFAENPKNSHDFLIKLSNKKIIPKQVIISLIKIPRPPKKILCGLGIRTTRLLLKRQTFLIIL